MAQPQPTTHLRRTSRVASVWAAVPLLLIALVLIGLPILAVVWGLMQESGMAQTPDSGKPLPWLFLSSVGWAGLVGVLATAVAIAPAWLVRSRGTRVVPFLLVPLCAPSYLAYSGWQLLRSPGTYLGDWIEGQTAASDRAALLFGKGLAVGGLTLWVWPLAMLLLIPAFRRIDRQGLEALQIDGAGPLKRGWQVLVMSRGGLLTAWAGVTLLMLGSAVPFHLAQVSTYSVEVWAQLAERPGDMAVWGFAWPVVAISAIAAAGVAWVQTREREVIVETGMSTPDTRTTGSGAVTILIWIAAVVIPLGLFAGYLHRWISIVRFVEVAAQAIGASVLVALWVGLAAVVCAAASWWAFSRPRVWRMGGAVALALFLLGMVTPGVLVGSAILRLMVQLGGSVPGADIVRDGPGVLVWGHLVRFGALGVLAGAIVAWTESRDLRELRAMDGGGVARELWQFFLRPHAGVLAAVGVACGLLSLYEIESTILLTPPGPGNLATTILDFLHFARDEQLCAVGVVVVGGGVLVAVGAAWLARRGMD